MSQPLYKLLQVVVSTDANSDAVVTTTAVVGKTTAVTVNNDNNTGINTVSATTTVTGDTSGNSLISIEITPDNIATNDFNTTTASTEVTYRSAPNTSNVSHPMR